VAAQEIVVSADVIFIADAMLGRLAKWLRLMGYDTIYQPSAEDRDLVRTARSEGRLLLTRDQELAQRRGLRSLLIESDRLEEQLGQLLEDLGLNNDDLPPRCALCNTSLRGISRSEARTRVPAYVYSTHEEFSWCPHCNKVYWRGTHWDRMKELIEKVEGAVSTPDS
jgi:uncharacterized protein with PIN domain